MEGNNIHQEYTDIDEICKIYDLHDEHFICPLCKYKMDDLGENFIQTNGKRVEPSIVMTLICENCTMETTITVPKRTDIVTTPETLKN